MSETISIRLSLTGDKEAAAGLKAVGAAGDRELSRIGKSASGASASLELVRDQGKEALSALAGFAKILLPVEFARQLLEVNREASRLRGSLVAGLGDTQKAGVAFQQLANLSTQYGLSLEKLTDGFSGLAVRGINPTMERLKAYAAFAAAIPGKDVGQFVEAVADAVTGEYARLQEFGIKARNEGEQVALSFGGTTIRVKNNAQAIAEAFEKLSRARFGDALEKSLDTLDTQLSRVGESWKALVRAVGDATGAEKAGASLVGRYADGLGGIAAFVDRANDPKDRKIVSASDIDSATAAYLQALQKLQKAQEDGAAAFDAAIEPEKAYRSAIAFYTADVERLRKRVGDLEGRAQQLGVSVSPFATRPTFRAAEESASSALNSADLAQLRGIDSEQRARLAAREQLASIGAAYGAGQIDDAEYARLKGIVTTERMRPITQAVADATLSEVRAKVAATVQEIEARTQALEATLGAGAGRVRAQYIEAAADTERRYGLPAGTIGALLQVESGFNPAARSKAGAIGIAQFMPSTAAAYGIDPTNPMQSIDGAGRYLSDLRRQFGGNTAAALAAYNGGTRQGQLVAGGLLPSKPETRNYIEAVDALREKYAQYGVAVGATDREVLALHKRTVSERLAADLQVIDAEIAAAKQQATTTEAEEVAKNARLAELTAERSRRVRQAEIDDEALTREAALRRVQVVSDSERDIVDQTREARADLIENDRDAARARLELARQSAQRELTERLALYPEELEAQREQLDTLYDMRREALERQASPLRRLAAEWDDVSRQMEEATASFASSSADAIARFVTTGKADFGSLAQSIIQDIIRIQIQQATAPFLRSLGGILGGTASAAPSFAGMLDGSALTFSASGNAFGRSGIIPFARGGIVDRPTLFPFARGTGLMGEAGPEAIMPLARDGAGRLGVRTQGGAQPSVTVNVVNQSSQPVDVQRSAPRVDGDRLVVDVLLRDLQRNGPAAQAMAGAFNLRRGA